MTRIVAVLAATLALTAAAPPELRSASNSIFQIDISPEEAQNFLNSPPFTSPQLSAKTATLPLVRWDDPRFRSAEAGPTNGHYWKNGHEIENTNDYDEEVYDAQQFHGQDGLGAYAYGYKAPESSKVENRARSGDVSGAYEYKAGNDDIIKVRYWADSEGFHQEDNLPRDLPKPVEEAEDVRQARLAHEKAWQEAAAAAAQQPDPQGEYNVNSQQQYQSFQQYQPFQQYQQSASEQRSVLAAPSSGPSSNLFKHEVESQPAETEPQQGASQIVLQGQHGQQIGAGQPFGQSKPLLGESNQQQPQYTVSQSQLGPQYGQQKPQQGPLEQQEQQRQSRQQGFNGQRNQDPQRLQHQQQQEDPEPTGPPRGFFYSFNYPVSIITRKGGEQESQHGQSSAFGRPGQQGQFGYQGRPSGQQPIDNDTVGVNALRP